MPAPPGPMVQVPGSRRVMCAPLDCTHPRSHRVPARHALLANSAPTPASHRLPLAVLAVQALTALRLLLSAPPVARVPTALLDKRGAHLARRARILHQQKQLPPAAAFNVQQAPTAVSGSPHALAALRASMELRLAHPALQRAQAVLLVPSLAKLAAARVKLALRALTVAQGSQHAPHAH